MRLQRYLAAAGVSARRKAETLITEGRVKVNGVVVTTLGTKVDPDVDQVTVDGEAVVALDAFYVLFNKPKGCITAVTDDRGRPVVMDYLPNLPVPVKPVGRLDFYSEGVLLLTNDGELAARLLAPSSHVPKTYHVKVHAQLSQDDIKLLCDGVQLDDGTRTMPAEITVLPGESKHTWLGITIHEGKHRQIHRMIEALGYRVDKLQRVAFANLTFHNLRIGDARELTQQELNVLRDAVGLDHSAVARGRWHSMREGTDIPRRARAKARDEAEELREGAEARRTARGAVPDEDRGASGSWDDDLAGASDDRGVEDAPPRGRNESSGRGQFGDARPRHAPERSGAGKSSATGPRTFGPRSSADDGASRPRAPMSRQIPGSGDSRVDSRGPRGPRGSQSRGDRRSGSRDGVRQSGPRDGVRQSGPRDGVRQSGPRDYRERMTGARSGSRPGTGERGGGSSGPLGGDERPSGSGWGERSSGRGAGERSSGRGAGERSPDRSSGRLDGGTRGVGERPSGRRDDVTRGVGERPSGRRGTGARDRSFGPGGGASERKAGPRGGGPAGRDRSASERSKQRWPRAEREAQRRADRPADRSRDRGTRSSAPRGAAGGGGRTFEPRRDGADRARSFKPRDGAGARSDGRPGGRGPGREEARDRSEGDVPPKRRGQGRSFGSAKPEVRTAGERRPKRGRSR